MIFLTCWESHDDGILSGSRHGKSQLHILCLHLRWLGDQENQGGINGGDVTATEVIRAAGMRLSIVQAETVCDRTTAGKKDTS
jgi:hypothetical protein